MIASACCRRSITCAISGRVGEVREARFLDDDAGLLEPCLQLRHERARHDVGAFEQRGLADRRRRTLSSAS